jgi:hypothetical protein
VKAIFKTELAMAAESFFIKAPKQDGERYGKF